MAYSRRIYKHINRVLCVSHDYGKTWVDLIKHLKEEHGTDIENE